VELGEVKEEREEVQDDVSDSCKVASGAAYYVAIR